MVRFHVLPFHVLKGLAIGFLFCSGPRIFHHIKIIGIDDSGLQKSIPAFEVPAIIGMDVTVKEEFRLVLLH